MTPADWILLSSIYVRQGINIAGYQNRIYDTGPTWALHLHPQGALVSITHIPSGQRHFISTTQIECMTDAESRGPQITDQPSQPAPSQHFGRMSDASGLVANQVAHKIPDAPVHAVSAPEILGPGPDQPLPAENPANKEQIQAKAEHLAPPDPPPQKKKRGRPRKVVTTLASNGSSL